MKPCALCGSNEATHVCAACENVFCELCFTRHVLLKHEGTAPQGSGRVRYLK